MKIIYKTILILLFVSLFFFTACDGLSEQQSLQTEDSLVQPTTLDNDYSTQEQSGLVLDTISELSDDSEFIVYYLDVGQAAAAFIICDGYTMLIDGGDVGSSSLIYSFLNRHEIDHLDFIVNTHPHADHVGGLAGALNRVSSVGTVFGSATEYDTRAFENFVKYLHEHGVDITIPKAGDSFLLGSALIEILAPVRNYNDVNNNSIVLKITYGETSFLFKGDAERESEIDILEAGYDVSATVLKVSHHGSDTSTTYPFLRAVMPEVAIISVGQDNQYGHPHDNLLSRLRDADVTIYRTDLQGDIIITSDGYNITVVTQRNFDIITNPTEAVVEEFTHIGNSNSKKFHRPDCHTLPAEHNRVELASRQHAVDDGFEPCGNCNP